jgi:hypothetical protein
MDGKAERKGDVCGWIILGWIVGKEAGVVWTELRSAISSPAVITVSLR